SVHRRKAARTRAQEVRHAQAQELIAIGVGRREERPRGWFATRPYGRTGKQQIPRRLKGASLGMTGTEKPPVNRGRTLCCYNPASAFLRNRRRKGSGDP